ncbi:hypothetical protein F2P56_015866 [Juglans regia]|uniref:Plastid-lipid-associated protein 6, chloroplastic isoform X4 n=2 Tax=Juglans regia TaxID=51240 RepID=A0A2I4ENF8_JUGRE|nr:plastid-lipid-associated protein 6, chloroplastic isoform X4 [Juglans regia]KAF5465906.1 hypothetical protein F2P56_015866 [Juglans regia]
MASLTLTSLPHLQQFFSQSSSSSSSIRHLSPSKTHRVTTQSPRRSRLGKLSPVPRSALDEVPVVDSPPPLSPSSSEGKFELISSLKLKLLSAVSGLNRGLAANEDDLEKADSAAKEVEDVGGLVDLSVDLDKLQGRWKLIYSSAFSSRTLGGSRPGPPTGRLLPITLGQDQSSGMMIGSARMIDGLYYFDDTLFSNKQAQGLSGGDHQDFTFGFSSPTC